MVDGQQGERLNELGLDGGSPHGHHRLPGEDGRALGDGPDIAGEAEVAQIVQKRLGEKPLAPQVLDVLLVEVQVFNIVDQLVQPRAHGEAALIGYVPEKHVEIGDAVLIARLEVAVAHGQLIKIAEHGQIQFLLGIHSTPRFYFQCLVT